MSRSVASALGLSFSRIQFTPDLLPADITGTHVYNERERTFEFNEGPVFANVVLADEINRAPPKTQSALLEAMEEGRVNADDAVLEYVAALARATREDHRVDIGVSPRGTERLFEAGRAMAAMAGRDFVAPDDVKRAARPVLTHRLVLTPDARVENTPKRAVVDAVLDQVPVPTA